MEPVRHLLVGDTLVTHYVFHADAQRAVGYDRETIAVYGNPTDSAGQQAVAAAQVNRIEARQGLLRIVTVNHAANLLASIGDSGTAKVWRLP